MLLRSKIIAATVLSTLLMTASFAQVKKVEAKYRRSSLHTILLEGDFPKKDTVIAAYKSAPFPDKYDDHNVGDKSFNVKDYPVNDSVKTEEVKNSPPSITKFFNDKKIGNKLVAKWFNRQLDGTFDMSLIGDRGAYNATEMQASVAKGAARGSALLRDAGIELLGNTFVVVTKMNFISNEITARIIRDAGIIAATQISNPLIQKGTILALNIAYDKAKEGYSIWSTSYLYKLKWNDSVEAVFYNNYWIDKSSIDKNKKEAFEKAQFDMEFVGMEKAAALITFSFKVKRSEVEIIKEGTIRSVDAVYSKLQKKYDVFKTKTPISSVDPVTAKIGLKEGVEGGDRFEVLEQGIDDKTGLTKYTRKGVVTADKKMIWDNRYVAGEAAPVIATTTTVTSTISTTNTTTNGVNTTSTTKDVKEEEKVLVDRTTFKGGAKSFYPGMLIRQIK
ncbi:MAG: hypothetical protein ACKVOU_06565 [Cytophagales bacterium]